MEGLAVAASIIAVVQITAKAASLSYKYIGDVEKSSSKLRRLVEELKALTGIITGIQSSQDPGSIILLGLTTPLQRYQREIKKLCDKLESKQKKTSWWEKTITVLKWPFNESETMGFILEVERFKMSLILAMNTDNIPRLNSIGADVQEIKEDNQKEKVNRISEKLTEVAIWLYPAAYDETHIEITGRRRTGTGGWILKAPEVMYWRRSSGLLWGYGIPGAGKTFLSSLMIETLQGQVTTGVAYVYFNYKEQRKQLPLQVLASLVRQLIYQSRCLPQKLEYLHVLQKRPTYQELYEILVEVVESFSETFLIFDALDECDQKTQRRGLLQLFHKIIGDSKKTHLFITSREYPEDIQYSFQNSPKIKLWAKDEDIASYVQQKISENPRANRLVGKHKQEIINELIDCAQGMFLLVHFHIEYLCQQTTIRQILEELGKLKHSSNTGSPLAPTYNRAMETIQRQPENCIVLATKILSWLVKAQTVLTIRELQLAVSVEPDRTSFDEQDLPDVKTMCDVCGSFVAIDEHSSTVRLVHYTVQEYLQQHPVIRGHASYKVAMACAMFLSSDLFTSACRSTVTLQNRLETYPFLYYAGQYLSHHLNECEENWPECALTFFNTLGNLSSYLQVINLKGPSHSNDWDIYPQGQTSLHVAATVGNVHIFQRLLENNDFTVVDADGRTPLHIAAIQVNRMPSQHSIAIVRLLLDKGSDVSVTDNDGKTALHYAASRGHSDLVSLLLCEGSDLSAIDKGGKTALHSAANSGHRQMVSLLLQKGSDLSATDYSGETALHDAVNSKNEDLVSLLLEKGSDPSVTDSYGNTVLHDAVYTGNKRLVSILLERGADASAANSYGSTVLHEAVYRGDKALVSLLLEKGVNISPADNDGKTPLHYATSRWSVAVGEILFQKHPDLSAADNDGKTALHYAASRGNREWVEMLLQEGADLSAIDHGGKTVLHDAAGSGHDHLVTFLLFIGSDISATDNRGRTALHHAAAEGHKDTVSVLLQNGSEGSAADKDRKTALHYAILKGHQDIVLFLLQRGVDISALDYRRRTALHYAIGVSDGNLVSILLQKGADPSVADFRKRTALHYAIEVRHKWSVTLLLQKGADVSASDEDGKTALHDAASKGFEDLVPLLLKNSNLSAIDNDGKTALNYAARMGHKKVIALLLNHNTKPSTQDKNGKGMPRLSKDSVSIPTTQLQEGIENMTPSTAIKQELEICEGAVKTRSILTPRLKKQRPSVEKFSVPQGGNIQVDSATDLKWKSANT